MKRLNHTLKLLPEYLLIVAVIFYWISTANVINPYAIILISGLILQIVFKNKTIGIIIPSLLIVFSFLLIVALFSELSEFPAFNREAKKLLIVRLTFFVFTILISVLMIFKYSNINRKDNQ